LPHLQYTKQKTETTTCRSLILAVSARRFVYCLAGDAHLGQGSEQDATVIDLIEIQRLLAHSNNPFERLVGTLLVAGLLDMRLAQLTDRQIGQLMFDHFGNDLGILLPETTICDHATRRLFRSAGGSLTTEDMEKQRQRPACPKCGGEMLLHYGIDEPDFVECVLLSCRHKEYVSADRERDFESRVGKTTVKEHQSHADRLPR